MEAQYVFRQCIGDDNLRIISNFFRKNYSCSEREDFVNFLRSTMGCDCKKLFTLVKAHTPYPGKITETETETETVLTTSIYGEAVSDTVKKKLQQLYNPDEEIRFHQKEWIAVVHSSEIMDASQLKRIRGKQPKMKMEYFVGFVRSDWLKKRNLLKEARFRKHGIRGIRIQNLMEFRTEIAGFFERPRPYFFWVMGCSSVILSLDPNARNGCGKAGIAVSFASPKDSNGDLYLWTPYVATVSFGDRTKRRIAAQRSFRGGRRACEACGVNQVSDCAEQLLRVLQHHTDANPVITDDMINDAKAVLSKAKSFPRYMGGAFHHNGQRLAGIFRFFHVEAALAALNMRSRLFPLRFAISRYVLAHTWKEKQRFRSRKQHANDEMIRWLFGATDAHDPGTARYVLVAGDTSALHGFKRQRTGGGMPWMSVLREATKRGFKAFFADESWTSAKTHCCAAFKQPLRELEPNPNAGQPGQPARIPVTIQARDPLAPPIQKTLRGVARCSNCGGCISRDFSSVALIFEIIDCALAGQPRPGYLTRAGRNQQKPPAQQRRHNIDNNNHRRPLHNGGWRHLPNAAVIPPQDGKVRRTNGKYHKALRKHYLGLDDDHRIQWNHAKVIPARSLAGGNYHVFEFNTSPLQNIDSRIRAARNLEKGRIAHIRGIHVNNVDVNDMWTIGPLGQD